MIISHSHKFIFFSNPKTGSESLRRLLGPYCEEDIKPWRDRSALHPFYPHMPPSEAQAIFAQRGWDFESYQRITCVRHPFARLVSLYEMIAAVDPIWKLRRGLGLSQPRFSKWLRSIRPDGTGGGGMPHQKWRQFGSYSADAWCSDLVTDVLRLEHIETELPAVLATLNLSESLKVPHVNKRVTRDWVSYYDAATRDLVERRYANDLIRFGYEIPELAFTDPSP